MSTKGAVWWRVDASKGSKAHFHTIVISIAIEWPGLSVAYHWQLPQCPLAPADRTSFPLVLERRCSLVPDREL